MQKKARTEEYVRRNRDRMLTRELSGVGDGTPESQIWASLQGTGHAMKNARTEFAQLFAEKGCPPYNITMRVYVMG